LIEVIRRAVELPPRMAASRTRHRLSIATRSAFMRRIIRVV
jgi:hypothetical protein